jgi:hypothetical protein
MKKVGLSGESLISWHREIHVHPIFDPAYAKENLVSLAETLVTLYFGFVTFVLLMHYFVLMGYIQTQTIPWLVIEMNASALMGNYPPGIATDKFAVFVALITTIMALKLVRRAFALLKAELHPAGADERWVHTLEAVPVAVHAPAYKKKACVKYCSDLKKSRARQIKKSI